jgi:N-acetylglucosamine repressor
MRHTGNSKYVKKLNRMKILNIIKEREPVSRQQLAEQTGLTPAAITGIIRELMATHFVKELGLGQSNGGRKPVKLHFNHQAGYVIGMELTQHETVIAIADLKNRPQDIASVKIDLTYPESGVPSLVHEIKKVIHKEENSTKKFMAVGIAFPGILHRHGNLVKRAVNLGPKWSGFPLKQELEMALSVPVSMENNAKAAALAEKWFGGGVAYDNLAYINMGEGISTGIILNNAILQGSHGYAGQIGHMVLDSNGTMCKCGNRGCLETICACPALLRKARAELPLIDVQDPLAKIWQEKQTISFSDIVHTAAIENSYSAKLLDQVGRTMGLVLANMINLYDPEAIFIGGKMASAGPLFIDVIRETVQSHAFPEMASSSKILLSSLGAHTGAIGACALVLKELLQTTESVIFEDIKPI